MKPIPLRPLRIEPSISVVTGSSLSYGYCRETAIKSSWQSARSMFCTLLLEANGEVSAPDTNSLGRSYGLA